LPNEVDWSEKLSNRSADIALEPSGPTLPLPAFISASSIAYPEMRPVWQQPGPSLVHASELQLRSIEQLYILRGRAEVIGFIKAYPFLAPLLLEAYNKIAEYFGPRTDVVLEVVSDPEAANHRELFILVRTGRTPGEALTLLGEC
jgi:hypothetical protein